PRPRRRRVGRQAGGAAGPRPRPPAAEAGGRPQQPGDGLQQRHPHTLATRPATVPARSTAPPTRPAGPYPPPRLGSLAGGEPGVSGRRTQPVTPLSPSTPR